jgi:hypothetical protein
MEVYMDDPELNAMAAIKTALDTLDETVRDRVLRWARDRYGVTAKTTPVPVAAASTIFNTTQASSRGSVSDVASLFDLANPTTETDKVLVVGYWFQVIRAEADLDSQSLNTELKNLGYPIGNITRAVSALASSTPRLIVQIKKGGTTRQARKKFRLTVEGIRRVEAMTGGTVAAVADEQSDG